jgi:hypothetical protein
MGLKYSCFISYRRNEYYKKYIINLKRILQSEAFQVTNKQSAFFDEDSIRYGDTFDNRIYHGIQNSYFFIALWYLNYLHEDNLYCAKELLHALKIEEIIREKMPEEHKLNFSFIIPFLVRGCVSELPACFSKKLVVDIKSFEYAITNNKVSSKLVSLSQRLYKDLSEYYNLFSKYISEDEYYSLCESIEKPDDNYVRAWIKEQRKEIEMMEAKKIPILKKLDGQGNA